MVISYTAEIVNQLVDRVNLSAEHTGSEYELDRVIKGQKITAGIWNDIETLITEVTPNKNVAGLGQTALGQLGVVQRTIPFGKNLTYTLRFRFSDYDQARYFFNSASEIKFYFGKTGGGAEDAE